MSAKLPKRGHMPIIGRREEILACVYIIGVASAQKPVKIGGCLKLQRQFEELQAAHYEEIKLRDVYWVADMALAQRVVNAIHKVLCPHRIRGDWFDVASSVASRELSEVAKSLGIPLMTNQQYHKICRGPAGRRANEIDAFLRKLGFTGI